MKLSIRTEITIVRKSNMIKYLGQIVLSLRIGGNGFDFICKTK